MRRGLLPALTGLSLLTVLAGTAAAQEVTLSSSVSAAIEGDAVTAELVLSHARSEDVTVRVRVGGVGSATSGEDFAAGPWNVTFPAGSTRQSLSILTFDDDKVEGDERFTIRIAGSGHSPGVRPGRNTITGFTIRNRAKRFDRDPASITAVTFSSASYRVNEGGTVKPELVLSRAPSEDVTVHVEVIGLGARSGEDFAAGPWNVTVPAGQTRHSFDIETFDDDKFEGDEQFILLIAAFGHSDGVRRSVESTSNAVVTIKGDPPSSRPARISVPNARVRVKEGGTAKIRVAIANPKSSSFTLDYTLSGDTASAADVVGGFGARSITVPANARHVDISIATAQDTVHSENVERFGVQLSTTASGVVFDTTDVQVSIADDDVAASFASASSRTNELSRTHEVTVVLSQASTSYLKLRFAVGGTATAGSDYGTPDGGGFFDRVYGTDRVAMVPGQTTATIRVPIIDDNIPEGDETIVLTLVDGSGYQVGDRDAHTLTIATNDGHSSVSFASASQRVVEGAGTRDVTVNLTPAPTADFTLDYTVGGTATVDADYTALSGSVTVSAGATTATIPVTILDDSDPEGDETVVLTLTGIDDYRMVNPKTHTLTIAASDGLTTAASFATASQSAVEGSGARDVTVNLNPPPASDITLNYTVGGTATPDSDYTALSGTLSVPAGVATATIPVTLLTDNVQEDGETVVLTLAPGTGYEPASPGAHTLTIVNLLAAGTPTVSLASRSLRVIEEAGTIGVTVNLNPPPTAEITLYYGIQSRTAIAGEDFDMLPGFVPVPLSVSAGATTATIPVTILDDSDPEGDETMLLALLLRTGYWRARPFTQTLTIAANDGVTAASFATASQRVGGETGTRDVTVNLDPAPASNITLNYTVGGTATPGSDYTRLSGTLSVPAGSSMATIPVTLLADNVQEDPETVVLTLAPGTGYEPASPDKHTLTFGTVMPRGTFATAGRVLSESAGTYRVPVRLTPAPTSAITVHYTVAGTATADSDYTALSGELTVLAGATRAYIPVTIIDDSVEDSYEWLRLRLTDKPGYTVGSNFADFYLYITNHELGDLEGRVQTRLDAAVADGDGAASNLWRRALAAVRGEAPPSGLARLTQADAQSQAASHIGSDIELALLWSEIADAIGSGVTDPPPSQVPEVTIAADAASVTEGTAASFALTADPAPAAPLDVTVTVATDGDYGITAGTQTITIPTAGSATLTLATAGDEVDEADGSVSVTVDAGTGYSVGSSSSGSVAIADDDAPVLPAGHPLVKYAALVADIRDVYILDHTDDSAHPKWKRVLKGLGDADYAAYPEPAMTSTEATDLYDTHSWARWAPVGAALAYAESWYAGTTTPPPTADPEVTIAAGAGVTEGTSATFTLTATPAPAAALDVTVTVATDGEFGITAGTQTVTIPTTGSYTLTLATVGDETDEPDGSVSVTVDAGTGYSVGDASSGSVTIADDDAPAPETGTAHPAVDPALIAQIRAWMEAPGANVAARNERFTRVLAAFGVESHANPMTVAEAEGYVRNGWGARWQSIVDALKAIEAYQAPSSTADSTADPEVTITAGSGVTEGGSATFTLTADPAPAAALDVTVTVVTDGDYGITAGTQTVTIPTTGSYVLTLATAGDEADEADGSVSVTVDAGTGYTVGAASSGSVAIADDDLPPPAISVAAKVASIAEGSDAVFTVTADRAVDADLAVTLTVSEKANSDFVAAADEGGKTVTILDGETEATLTVKTVDDKVDEPDGSVISTLAAGAGYTVAPSPADAASVAVADNDAAGLPTISVEDVTVQEGGTAVIPVRLSPAPTKPVRLFYKTMGAPVGSEGYASWADFKSARAWLNFRPGETLKHARVRTVQDSHDDGGEWFEVFVIPAQGHAVPAAGVYATVTIENDDPMPGAYLARFGRTVAEQALDGIAGRMSADRTPGMRGTVAGQALSFDPAASDPAAAMGATLVASGTIGTPGTTMPGPADRQAALAMADIARGFGADASAPAGPGSAFPGSLSVASGAGPGGAADRFGVGHGWGDARGLSQSRTMTARDALLGSSFSLTGQRDGAGGSLAFWGRASQGSFDGAERGDGTDIRLDGTVTTGMLGADYARGNWLVGLALTQSSSEGSYAAIGGEGDGDVEASLTAAIPYAALRASERLKLWGAAGYGTGEVTLKTAPGSGSGAGSGEKLSADTSWAMAAAGVRGDLLTPPDDGSGGPALALTSDALWARTSSDKTGELNATESDVTRLRLGLEGSYRIAMEGDSHLIPKLEIGARHDGGDAETGFGVELGGGIAWVDPSLGLSLDVSGRTLLAHENDDLKDRGFSAALGFDPAPATRRGPSFSLRQDFGGQASGGLDALFATDPLEDRTGSETTSRWAMEAAYGFPVFGDRFTGSPHVGLGLSTGARDYSLGWRVTPEAASAPDLSFGVKATRRESDAAEAEHTVGFEIRARW